MPRNLTWHREKIGNGEAGPIYGYRAWDDTDGAVYQVEPHHSLNGGWMLFGDAHMGNFDTLDAAKAAAAADPIMSRR